MTLPERHGAKVIMAVLVVGLLAAVIAGEDVGLFILLGTLLLVGKLGGM